MDTEDFDLDEFAAPPAPATVAYLAPSTPSGVPDYIQWGALAMELELQTAPLPKILATYNLSHEQLEQILVYPAFVAEQTRVRDKIKAIGDDAGIKLRAQALAERNLSFLAQMAGDAGLEPQYRLQAMKMIHTVAGVDRPETPRDLRESQANTGATVIFQIENMPKPTVVFDAKSH
jgi:hypothetical protein